MTTLSNLKQQFSILANLGISRQAINWIVGTIILICSILLLLLHSPFSSTTESSIRNLIVSGVRNVSELTTAETTIKATVTMKEEAKLFYIVPTGDTNLIYEGVGTVKAGIKPREIQVLDIDSAQRRIHLLLPAPYISGISLDVDRSATLANYKTWFGHKAGPELYDEAQRKVVAEIRQDACGNKILEVASANAANQIEEILKKANFKEVEIETQLPKGNDCPLS